LDVFTSMYREIQEIIAKFLELINKRSEEAEAKQERRAMHLLVPVVAEPDHHGPAGSPAPNFSRPRCNMWPH